MAIFIFIILLVSGLYFYLSNKNDIMYNYEVLSKNEYDNDTEKIPKKNHIFWIILYFIETIVFLTYALLIVKSV